MKGRISNWLRLHVVLVYSFLYTPILVLVAYSFNRSKRNATWQGFTLDWYRELLGNAEVWGALLKSLEIAAGSTLLATVLGTLAALGLAHLGKRSAQVLESALYLSMVTPEVVMGVSLLALFVSAGVTLSTTTVILAHASMSTSFVAILVRTRLHDYDRHLDEAAADLGAGPWETFFYVTLPVLAPGIVAGALLAFTLSFDDFVISFFNSGAGSTTLPIKIYSMIKFGISPAINCASTLMLVVTVLLMLVSERLRGEASASDR